MNETDLPVLDGLAPDTGVFATHVEAEAAIRAAGADAVPESLPEPA